VVGCAGVESSIAPSLAATGPAMLGLYDAIGASAETLAACLRQHYPALSVSTRTNDPDGYDIVVNSTPLRMDPGAPLPFDVSRIASTTFVGEVVMKAEYTP